VADRRDRRPLTRRARVVRGPRGPGAALRRFEHNRGLQVYAVRISEVLHCSTLRVTLGEQFRARGASILDRRHALVAPAGTLDRRRGLPKAELLGKDEGIWCAIREARFGGSAWRTVAVTRSAPGAAMVSCRRPPALR